MACNAKKELLSILDSISAKVVCARVAHSPNYFSPMNEEGEEQNDDIVLRVGYTEQEYQDFLDKLDFMYDDGYGSQELYGTVWLTDGIWLDRSEYDGSEWWEAHKYPTIPDKLNTSLNDARLSAYETTLGQAE